MSLKANKCTSLSSLKGCILFCGADNPSFTQGVTHWEDTSSWGIVESTRLEVTQPTPAAAAVLVVIIQIYIYFFPHFFQRLWSHLLILGEELVARIKVLLPWGMITFHFPFDFSGLTLASLSWSHFPDKWPLVVVVVLSFKWQAYIQRRPYMYLFYILVVLKFKALMWDSPLNAVNTTS